MATTTTVTSNYEGKAAGAIIGGCFKEADTLRLGLLSVAENVNFKLNLRKIQYTDGTVDYACGFTPEGAIALTEKVLEPKKLMNPFQICKEQFRATWSEDLMGASAWNVNAPRDIMEAITLEVLSSQAAKIDDDIWNGVAATAGEFNGLLTQFATDADIIKIGSGITRGTDTAKAAVTEDNVLPFLKLALSSMPDCMKRKDVVVAVSPDVFQAYTFFLIGKGISNDGNAENKQARFGRYTLTEVNGLPANTIVIFEKKNVVFATGLLADHNELKIVDEDEIGLLTGFIRGKMVYNAGVGYYNSDEIVWLDTNA